VRIVVDDPELVFSSSQELDTHLVGGFCLAALRLSAEIKGFKVIAFLKTHVYHPVSHSMEDLSKYPMHMARLSWTIGELESLVARRLDSSGLKWTDVFDCKDEDTARNVLKVVANKLRNGPRDLLFWLDLALNRAVGRKVKKQDFEETRRVASDQAFKEMESAHYASYEMLGSVIRAIFEGCSSKEFTPLELKQHVQNLMVTDTRLRAYSVLPWMQRVSSETLPRILFEVGALALRWKSQTIPPYRPEYDQNTFETAETVLLTPALAATVESN
jgi:hypothetical protein